MDGDENDGWLIRECNWQLCHEKLFVAVGDSAYLFVCLLVELETHDAAKSQLPQYVQAG